MPPILLIPGNMCDARLWLPVAKRLAAAGYTVRDAPRLDHASIEAMTEAVELTIEVPSVIVGFSMGAIVAARLALRAPAKVAALGLVAFNASADLPQRAAVRPRQQQDARDGRLDSIIAEELKPNYLADANRGDARLLAIVMEMARALGPHVFVAQSEALRLRADLRDDLPNLEMPVFLACGSEDRLCPPEWHCRWASMIGPNANCIEVPNAGHLLPLEQPRTLSDSLISWLAKEAQCSVVS